MIIRGDAMFETILFDLDGTLTDPALGITNSVAYALSKWDISVNDRSELFKFIGPPLLDSFAEYYGFSHEQSRLALKYYREYFTDRGMFENRVYEGIPQLLSQLKAQGKRLIVATSKPEEFAVRILHHFGLDRYFDFIGGASMDETRVKKADVIQYALETCNITDRSSVVMVGDRLHDINGAKACGLPSIGVAYGYGSIDELKDAGADFIAISVQDILKYI